MHERHPMTQALRMAGRPSKGEAEARLRHLLAVASREFQEKGYGGASLESIARAAGVGKSTIYRHFTSKELLFRAIVERLAEGLGQEIGGIPTEGRPVRDVLTDICRTVTRAAFSPEAVVLHRLILTESPRFGELARSIDEAGQGAVLRPIARYLERLSRAGHLRPHDPTYLAEQLVQLAVGARLNKVLLGSLPIPDIDEQAQRTTLAVELFLDGCITKT